MFDEPASVVLRLPAQGATSVPLSSTSGATTSSPSPSTAPHLDVPQTMRRKRRREKRPASSSASTGAWPGPTSSSPSSSSSSLLSSPSPSSPSLSTQRSPLHLDPVARGPASSPLLQDQNEATSASAPTTTSARRRTGRLPAAAAAQGLLFLLLLLMCKYTQALISKDLVVETDKGKVRGVTLKSATSKDVDVWYGIPFAQPPVGNLRFRHPRPMDKWTGIKETTKQPNSCVQPKDTLFPGFGGAEMWNANTPLSEDCLYLNVVVPRPHPRDSAVLVWFYGGGFYSGTMTLDVYDPRVLVAEENIIYVAINYRVSSLGFLSFDTEDVPGNAGMFDQLMALQWIRDNIAAFGGNPENITLFGESAGAASIGLHLLSPLSRNLFSQAILQSASALVPWGVITKDESALRGLRLAELMGCPHTRPRIREAIDCLRETNSTALVIREWEGIVFGVAEFPFVPVIDGAFLDETPQTAMNSKNFKKTNILLGVNRDEGNYFLMYYLTDLFRNQENVFVTREDFKKAVAEVNLYVKEVGKEAIIFEYSDWLNPLNPLKNRDALDKMVGDYAFTCPTTDFAHRYAQTGNNVYMYYFSERASTNPWPTWSGVLHADEIAFIFGEPLNRSKNYDQSEIMLSKRMMAYWANFAKTGNPSLSADGTWTTDYWPLHTPVKREVLELNANFTRTLEGHRVKKCAFWKKFLPRLLSLDSPRPCDKSCCPVKGETGSKDPNGSRESAQSFGATALVVLANLATVLVSAAAL